MIVEVLQRPVLPANANTSVMPLPSYLSGDESTPLFSVLMKFWLDNSWPVPADQNRMAA